MVWSYERGKPLPLGMTVTGTSVNFAVFSRSAFAMSLLLYAQPHDTQPCQEIILEPKHHRSGDIWHICLTQVTQPLYYHYRADGPGRDELVGHHFDQYALLLDPYAVALTGSYIWNLTGGYLPKAIACIDTFDWGHDVMPQHAWSDLVIYEAHVRGFTQRAAIPHAGTYMGIIAMIPYLKSLGINALELLPVFEFDEFEYQQLNPITGQPVKNYWGYSTIAFFAPKGLYASQQLGQQMTEFKTMVKALHQAGIEVILDVVFNHTAEGNEKGAMLNFKGLANNIYYMLYEDKRYYWNYSGCGNTVNSNHPIVQQYIIDCLRYWVVEMHVDGFRFDLASILCRDQYGHMLTNPPLIEKMSEDPVLAHIKMIAEPWDAAGGYLVGRFPGTRFAEWNDRYRDDVRAYWRNDAYKAGALATRLGGSSDLYANVGKTPMHSLNYVTAHDGFTLYDLVSYQSKHNTANGHRNEDGGDNNISWNCGAEGETDDKSIQHLRIKQMKNLCFTLFVSRGIPMMCGGDEIARTQQGNNNAYCQDNEISWHDYERGHQFAEIKDFFTAMIHLRKDSTVFSQPQFFTGRTVHGTLFNDIEWYDTSALPRDWGLPDNCFSCRLVGCASEAWLLLFNPTTEECTFSLAVSLQGYQWGRRVDTSLPAPHDAITASDVEALMDQVTYQVSAHSAVCLQAVKID